MNEKNITDQYRLCKVDFGMKTGVGSALGLMTSALFTNLKPWPIYVGAAIGITLAYVSCEDDFITIFKKCDKEPDPAAVAECCTKD